MTVLLKCNCKDEPATAVDDALTAPAVIGWRVGEPRTVVSITRVSLFLRALARSPKTIHPRAKVEIRPARPTPQLLRPLNQVLVIHILATRE